MEQSSHIFILRNTLQPVGREMFLVQSTNFSALTYTNQYKTAKTDRQFQHRGTLVQVAKNHVIMDIRAVKIQTYY
jgi:hypothetical protein